jgi:hypothetical protein
MAKYLSGRVQRIPQSGLTSDRYSYLSLDQAEPNLGDPVIPGAVLPAGDQYQIVSVLNRPGERYWIPVGGGLIPGAISVYDEGVLVPPGGVSSIRQLNFVGAAISASGYLDSYGNPGAISTITVFAPGNNKELIFNSNNEFSSSVDLTYDTNTGILTAGRRLNVGVGGTVISTTGIGSVGIGTTNPTAKLHIVGDLRLSGTIYDYLNNPGSTQQILVKNALGSLVWTSQGSIKAGAGGTFNQVQYHNSTGLVDGAVNFVYDPINSRVGIGSTLPTYLLDVTGDTRISGIATLNKLYVTGISTFSSSLDSTNATSGALIISGGVGIAKNLNVGTAVSTVSLTVTGQTTIQNLNVVGVSTLFDIEGTSANFSGIVTASTFKGQISSGVGTITTFNSTTGTISALTGTSVTYTNGNITTLNGSNAYYNAGIITALTSTNSTLANIISSGISTLGITTTTQLTARSLNVSGITTTQTLNVSSTSTFGGSVTPSANASYNIGSINYKWNSLYVSTIVADTITGNTNTATSVIGGYADITSSNVSGISTTQYLIVTSDSSLGIATATSLSSQSLSVAGVATVPTLNSTSGNITTLSGTYGYHNIGIITSLSGTAVTYTTGNITTLNGSNAYYNTGIVTTLSGTNLTYATGNITTLNGSNAYYNAGIVTTLSGTSLTYTNGSITALTGTAATITTGNITTLSGTYSYHNVGIVTALTGTAVTYTTGNIATLSGTNAYYNIGIVTTLSGTYGYHNIGVITALSGTGITYTNANFTNLSAGSITYTNSSSNTLSAFDGYINAGIITTLSGTDLTYTTGNITTLNGSNAYYNAGIVTTLSGTSLTYSIGNITSLISQSINVTGVITATTFKGALNGNADTATKLATGRTIAITGDLAYTSPSFDGTTNVTATGTLANTGVAAATYGSSTQIPVFAVDSKGRVTSVTNTSISFGAATVASADKLTNGRTIAITGDLAYTSPSFDGTANVTATGTLANTGVAADTYGSTTTIPQIAVDAKGRITSASSVSVNFSSQTVASADKLTNGRTIAITGDLTYTSPSFDGTANVTAVGTLATLSPSPAGTYGNTTTIPQITVDAKGRVTSVSGIGVNFSSQTVAQADKLTNGRTIAITGDLTYTSPSFDGTANVTATSTLANSGVAAATYGSGTQVPVFAVDSKGRITSVTNTSITGINASSVAAAGSNTQIQFNDSNVFAGNANLTFNKITNTFATSLITANSITISGDGSTLYGPNSTWAEYLRVGGNGNADTTNASVVTTNGNLHLDAKNGAFGTYINYYKGTGGVNFGNGASATVGSVDSSGNSSFRTIASTVATGTSPLTVTSTTQVTNLNSNYLNGITATQFFNNMGNIHTTRTDFNASTNFGFNYIQGSTNGPGIPSATQYYNLSIGLGNDYAYSQYAMEFAIPRTPAGGNPYPSVRFREGGTWGSWSKIYAGYADSAGSSTNSTNATTATNLSGGSVAATTGTFSNYLRTLEQVRATGWYGTPTGSSYTGLAVEMGMSAGQGYVICYNRDTSAYGTLNLQATGSAGISIPASGTTITVTGSISVSGSVAGTNITSGGNVTGSSASCAGNAATATNLSTGRTNWSTNGTITAVVGQLAWKNYGNSHTIFDASASTSPEGGAVNNTNSQVVWSSTYPTLMGWNGSNTYGVRVDSARISDSAPFDGLTSKASGSGTYTTSGDFRAPIFYDSNDTAYYTDPASTSNLNNCTAIRYLARASGVTLGTGNSAQLEINNAASGACNISFHREGDYGAHFGLDTDNVFSTYGWSAGSGYTSMRVGNLTASGTVTANSDIKLKKNISTLTNSLDKVLQMRGVEFDRIDIEGEHNIGFIAQEIEKIVPELVRENKGTKSVAYGNITALLVEAIKELKVEIEELKSKIPV